jgi:hypothetical protein
MLYETSPLHLVLFAAVLQAAALGPLLLSTAPKLRVE